MILNTLCSLQNIKTQAAETLAASYTTRLHMGAKPACAIRELEGILGELASIRQNSDLPEEPFNRATDIVSGVVNQVDTFPSGGVLTIPQGVWIVWRTGNRNVQLLCSVHGESEDFLYTSITEDRRQREIKTIHPVNSKVLAEHLGWMQANPS